MLLPKSRGSLSAALFTAMRGIGEAPAGLADNEEDAHISLWALYELHYQGFDDVDEAMEWRPDVLTARYTLERDFERRLRNRFQTPVLIEPFSEGLFAYIAGHDGASLASFVHRDAALGQVRELLRYRSIYHLKESDPQAWVVPRLSTVPKAALMELQYDEYGCGDPNRLHSHLFAQGLRACGLSPEYGVYINEAPVEVLAQNNAMSLFGVHRRLRGAALGHLAAFEATSSLPSRHMAQGLARLDFPREMVHYYEEHVQADAVHEQLAVRTICGALVEQEPHLIDDVVFGAFTCMDLEGRFARQLLDSWS